MSDTTVPLIVVGVDGSALSVEALRWAADHARRIGGRLLAVTGFEVPWTIFFAPTATEADYADAAREILDRTVTEALGEDPGVPVETHLAQNRPAQALTTHAPGPPCWWSAATGGGSCPACTWDRSRGTACTTHRAPCWCSEGSTPAGEPR